MSHKILLAMMAAVVLLAGLPPVALADGTSVSNTCPENKYRKIGNALSAQVTREIRKDVRNDRIINRNFARLDKLEQVSDAQRALLDSWNTYENESHRRARTLVATFQQGVDAYCELDFDLFFDFMISFADQGLSYNIRGIEFFSWVEANWIELQGFIPTAQQRSIQRDMRKFRETRAASDATYQELKDGALAGKQARAEQEKTE